MKLVARIVIAVAISVAVLYGADKAAGPLGLVVTAPVLGLLARPLVDLVTGFPRFAARMAMRRYEGRYFEFRGRSMDIHIDADARCWVCTADARKIVALPADAVLNRMAPLECGERGDPVQWRITPEALVRVLARSSDPDVTKFCRWLEKDVARPARNRLQRRMALR